MHIWYTKSGNYITDSMDDVDASGANRPFFHLSQKLQQGTHFKSVETVEKKTTDLLKMITDGRL